MDNGEDGHSGGDNRPQDGDFAEFGYGGNGGVGTDWAEDLDEEEENEGDEGLEEEENQEGGGLADQQAPFDSWGDDWGEGEEQGREQEQGNQNNYDEQAEDDITALLRLLASRLTIQNQTEETPGRGVGVAEAITFSRITRSEYYPNAARVVEQGLTFLQKWRQKDVHTELRDERPYHPFSSLDEWQFSNLLFRLPCSLNWKTELLSTNMVRAIDFFGADLLIYHFSFRMQLFATKRHKVSPV